MSDEYLNTQQQAASQQAYAQQQARYGQHQAYAQQQAAPQQGYYGQSMYGEQYPYGAYPPPQPPMPQMREQLTGGQKFGWLLIGFLMNIPGILLAWLANGDAAKQVRSSAVKFALLGFVIEIVLAILGVVLVGGMLFAVLAELMEDMDYTYYSTALAIMLAL